MINNKQNIIASDIIDKSDLLTREWRDMYNYRMTLEYDGGSGGANAAPIARDVMKKYLGK